MDFIYEYWEKRFNECKRCDFKREWYGGLITCGTPVIGEIVNTDEEAIKLCGCIMNIKTKIANAECPINKWNNDNNTDSE